MNYPKIKAIEPNQDLVLKVTFDNDITKKYNCRPLLDKEPFSAFKNKHFFMNVKVDVGGYAAIWNDEVDLAESELWENGE